MKPLILSLISLPLFCISQNSSTEKTDAENEGLKGKVKQEKCDTYTGKKNGDKIVPDVREGGSVSNYLQIFDNKGRRIEQKWFKPDESLESSLSFNYSADNKTLEIHDFSQTLAYDSKIKCNYTFNTKGLKTQSQCYDTTGALLGTEEYNYDSNGNQTEFISYASNKSIIRKEIYTCNAKGKRTEEVVFDGDGKVTGKRTMKYDDKGHEIEWTSYNTDGSPYLTKSKTYNEKGFLIESIDKHHDGILYFRTAYSVFTAKGNPLEGKSLNKDGSVDQLLKCKYDSNDNLTEMNWYNVDGTLTESTSYEYDKEGNWIKKILFSGGNYTITLRKIDYF